MNGGIESLVQDKMNVNRSNPGALAQSYQQNQQLLDLLALQRLKSEKEAAKRDMLLKAGQNPMPTVAQSREQEMLGQAKQEVASQVGVAGQKMVADRQQAMQQLMRGIGGLPANSMSNSPQGGIAGYQSGGTVASDDEIVGYDGQGNPITAEHFRRITAEERRPISELFTEEIPEQLRGLAGLLWRPVEEDERIGARARKLMPRTGEMWSELEGSPAITRAAGTVAGLGQDISDFWGSIGEDVRSGVAAARQGVEAAGRQVDEGVAAASREPEAPRPQTSVESAPAETLPAPAPAPQRMSQVAPETALEGEVIPSDDSGIATLPPAQESEYDTLIRKRREYLRQLEDPRRRRMGLLARALQGGASGTSIADSLAGMGRAAGEEGARQEQGIMQALNAVLEPMQMERDAATQQQYELEQIDAQTKARLEEVSREVAGRLQAEIAGNTTLSPRDKIALENAVREQLNDPLQMARWQAEFVDTVNRQYQNAGQRTRIRAKDLDEPQMQMAFGRFMDAKIREEVSRRTREYNGGSTTSDIDALVERYGG